MERTPIAFYEAPPSPRHQRDDEPVADRCWRATTSYHLLCHSEEGDPTDRFYARLPAIRRISLRPRGRRTGVTDANRPLSKQRLGRPPSGSMSIIEIFREVTTVVSAVRSSMRYCFPCSRKHHEWIYRRA